MYKSKLLALLVVSTIILTGCAGTSFDKNASAKAGSLEFEAFCKSREDVALIVNTTGFLFDLFVPQGVQAVSAVSRGKVDEALNNPTTLGLNNKCDEAKSE